jgi:hypothetical protein
MQYEFHDLLDTSMLLPGWAVTMLCSWLTSRDNRVLLKSALHARVHRQHIH